MFFKHFEVWKIQKFLNINFLFFQNLSLLIEFSIVLLKIHKKKLNASKLKLYYIFAHSEPKYLFII